MRSKSQVFSYALLVFIAALLIRGAWAIASERFDPFLQNDPLHGDASSYDFIAVSLMNGTGYSVNPPTPDGFWPPIYPIYLAGLYSIVGHNFLIARLVQAVMGAFTCLILYWIGRRLFSERIGRIAGVLAVIFPYHIYFGNWLIAENLYFLLFALTLWTAILIREKPNYRLALLLGVLVGIDILAKPVTLFFLPFAGIFFLVSVTSKRVPIILLASLGMAVVVGVWVWRNHQTFGGYSLSMNGGYTFYGANNPDAFGGHIESFPAPIPGLTKAEQDSEYYRLAIQWITHDPGGFAKLVSRKYLRLLSPLIVASWEQEYPLPFSGLLKIAYWTYLGIAVTGIVLTRSEWRKIFILLVPIFGVLLSVCVFYGDTRYTLPTFPSMLLFASVTIDRIYSAALQRRVPEITATVPDSEPKSSLH